MKLLGLDCETLKDWIAQWLAAVAEGGAHPAIGLERQEAVERARQLLGQIARAEIAPADFDLDENSLDVLYALVALISIGGQGAGEVGHLACVVYDFIREIRWPDDDFGEKDELLNRCVLAAGRTAPETDPLAGSSADDAGAAAQQAAPPPRGTLSEEELRRIFEENRLLIHAIFVKHHQIDDAEALDLEGELLNWFVRFCHRTANPPQNPRAVLLAACSNFALSYLRWGVGAAESEKKAGRLPGCKGSDRRRNR